MPPLTQAGKDSKEETKQPKNESEPSVRTKLNPLQKVSSPLAAMNSGVHDVGDIVNFSRRDSSSIKETFEVYKDIDIASTSFS